MASMFDTITVSGILTDATPVVAAFLGVGVVIVAITFGKKAVKTVIGMLKRA